MGEKTDQHLQHETIFIEITIKYTLLVHLVSTVDISVFFYKLL